MVLLRPGRTRLRPDLSRLATDLADERGTRLLPLPRRNWSRSTPLSRLFLRTNLAMLSAKEVLSARESMPPCECEPTRDLKFYDQLYLMEAIDLIGSWIPHEVECPRGIWLDEMYDKHCDQFD